MSETNPDTTASAESGAYPKSTTGWAVVAILMVCYVFSYLDRGVLALLVEPLKQDFGLSDNQVSLLMGPAFVRFSKIYKS